MTLNLYSFFHLNLAYSAIEEADRSLVIEKCYWPLLSLAKDGNYPFGFEMSGYTLESINKIDSSWVKELSLLINGGNCELIGSGYSQIIGPLVPPEITCKNLELGNQIYKDNLGTTPSIALLNEQAFSSGLVNLYEEQGYKAIIMEWNNPAKENPDWDEEWRYLPQKALGIDNKFVDLIWNKSISFQKFQRYVHGEISLLEMIEYLKSHDKEHLRAFPLYGNDVEIFDFRPGRYMTEANIHVEGEWKRISKLYETIALEATFNLIKPSDVLKLNSMPNAGNALNLCSASQPIPVKKQDKYNIVRWAVSGRDDLGINTRCWKLFEKINQDNSAKNIDWKELLYLWSSDFRTHITESRWIKFLDRLKQFENKWSGSNEVRPQIEQSFINSEVIHKRFKTSKTDSLLKISGERLFVELNHLRGLAIHSFADLNLSREPLFGTLKHGFFDDISWGADYYSGHLIFDSPGKHKITDLLPVDPDILDLGEKLLISGKMICPLGSINKTLELSDLDGSLKLTYKLDWPKADFGSLRLGYLTLFPSSFDVQSLYFASQNGGRELEQFKLTSNVNHGKPVSSLVSANQAVAATSGVIDIGDKEKVLRVSFKPSSAALIALIAHQSIRKTNLTRTCLAARELDDTSKPSPIGALEIEIEFSAIKTRVAHQ